MSVLYWTGSRTRSGLEPFAEESGGSEHQGFDMDSLYLMDHSDSGFMGGLTAVMYWSMEQSLPKRRSFTLTLIFTRLRFSDILAASEGQII